MTIEYEYRLSEIDPRTVEIRHKHAHAGRRSSWRVYLLCDSEDEAERVLETLQRAQEYAHD